MAKVSLREVGESGLVQWQGLVSESYTSALEWPGCYDTYNEMRRRDPTIRTIWNALILLARTATWYVEPGEDSEAGQAAAAYIEECLEGMSHTIEDYVEDALTCVPFGWAWLEIVYKRRDDGRIGWKKWAMRRQSSFAGWKFDAEGGVQALLQRPAPDYETRTIPVDKSLHFTSQRDGGNPEGFALLESIYETWYFVKNLQIINGIGWQRTFVGLPVFEVEEKPSSEDKGQIEAVGQGLQVDEKQYVSVPPGVKFRLESASNAGASALLDTIRYYRLLMMQTLLADFINLGTGQTGSWALGSDKSQLFLMAVDGFLDRIGMVINRFGVERLLGYDGRYVGVERPRVVHTKVEKPALGQIGNWLQQVQPLINWTPEDEVWLRKRGGLPAVLQRGEGERGGEDEGEPDEQDDEEEDGEPGELAELAAERGAVEARLARVVRVFMADQLARVTQAAAGGVGALGDAFWEHEARLFRAVFLGELMRTMKDVVGLAIGGLEETMGGGADWAMVNENALRWARKHAGELIEGVTKRTQNAVREAVAAWIESGGEMKDLVDALEPLFGRSRAELIAVTEVTRAYGEANDLVRRQAGLPGAVMREPAHPNCRCNTRPHLLGDGTWVIVWETARDELVCQQPVETPWGTVDGCGALQGMVVSERHGGKYVEDL